MQSKKMSYNIISATFIPNEKPGKGKKLNRSRGLEKAGKNVIMGDRRVLFVFA